MLLPRLKYDNVPEVKLNVLQKEVKNQVAKKIEKKIYQFEEIKCPICETTNKEIIGEKDRYGLFFRTNICKSCGLVYTSPRMTQESYNQFYNEEYRKLYVGKKRVSQAFYEVQKNKGKVIYDFLEQIKTISHKSLFVFEVGCGAGGLLDVFRENGHIVKGIDLGKEYVNFGRDVHGLDLSVGVLSGQQFSKKPDILIYSHALEHILDLNQELKLLKRFTTKETLIYIEVPGIKEVHKNYGSNILKYFQNAHTFHFTLETLSNLFAKNGFKLISGNQFVQSVFRHADDSNTIQNDYVKSKHYILNTEEKCKAYFIFKNRLKKGVLAVQNIIKIK